LSLSAPLANFLTHYFSCFPPCSRTSLGSNHPAHDHLCLTPNLLLHRLSTNHRSTVNPTHTRF
jgi:hypothetical protein